ncbi:MAG: anaerobic ribonucleoside-triphosphate reductase [Patescibacteria group bacterium]
MQNNDLLVGGDLSAKRQACEVYSRIVGYLRPVTQWNKGKKAEFYDRCEYDKQLTEAV